jgi:uncharacterized coiled-coil protein SlyX
VKGSIVQDILISLSVKEREAFLGNIGMLENGSLLTRICLLLQEGHPDPDSRILRKFRISKGEKFKCLEQTFSLLVAFAASTYDSTQLRSKFEYARRLLRDARFESAAAIIQASLVLAEQADDFEMQHLLFELTDLFPEDRKPALDKQQRFMAVRQAERLAVTRRLMLEAEACIQQPRNEATKSALTRIKEEAIQHWQQSDLAPKAKYLALKATAICHALLSEFEAMVTVQEKLIAHIEQNPTVVADSEFAIAKETTTLLRTLWVAKLHDGFREKQKLFLKMRFISIHAEVERICWRFPLMLIILMEVGDKEGGEKEIEKLMELLEQPDRLPKKHGFLSQNLYCCAYFYIASANFSMISKIFGKMNRLAKSDFQPRYYLMSRLLRLIYEIDLENWEDAITLALNLKKSKIPPGLEGFETLVSFLIESIRSNSSRSNTKLPIWHQEQAIRELNDKLTNSWILEYFDFFAWIEAKRRNIPLLTIFQQRADSQTSLFKDCL